MSPNNESSTPSRPVDRTATENIVFVTIYAALVALVIVLNSLVVCAYRKNRKLQTATNLLFVYLATSDLLVGTVSIPLWTIHEYIGHVEIPPRKFIQAYYFFDMFSALSSIMFLTAISVERNLAISKPIYHRMCPLHYYHVTSFVIWLCVLTLAVIFVQELGPIWRNHRGIVSFLFGFVLPICLILVMYFKMWKSIKRFESRRRTASFRNNLRVLQRERKAAWTVAIVIGLFVVSWLPFFTFSVLYVLCGAACMPVGVHARHAVDVVKLLHYSNSAINPLVYSYRNVDMRRAVWGTVTCRRPRRMRRIESRVQRAVPLQDCVMRSRLPLVQENGLVHTHCIQDTPL